jgi:hypothetical protein
VRKAPCLANLAAWRRTGKWENCRIKKGGADMEWKPIGRGRPQVLGVHPQYRGLLEIEIELDSMPSAEWVQAFNHPAGVSMSMSMHPPRLSGSTIYIRPPDQELASYIEHIDERIAAANATYEARVLPQERAAALREKQVKEEETRRVEEARKKSEKL